MLLYIWASKLSHFSGCNLRMKPLQQYYPDSNKNPDSDAWLHRTSANYACYTQRIYCKLFRRATHQIKVLSYAGYAAASTASKHRIFLSNRDTTVLTYAGYAAASLLTRFFPCCMLTASKLQIELQICNK